MNAASALRARALAPVLAGLAEVPPELAAHGERLAASDLALDSASVTPGAAFVACRGRRHHGLEYAEAAVARGARVILWESAPQLSPPPLPDTVAMLEVPALRSKLGQIADRFYESPSAHLAVSAITGTNGKTTTAWLVAQALERLGQRAAYLGTLGAGVPGALQPLAHTTPDVLTLHRLLARLYAAGTDSVAMEISSHALDQDRCAGVRLHSAAFTNLTRDHLDYHGDMASYAAAKAKLFAWPALTSRVINIDDPFGATLAERWLGAPGAHLFVTSRQPAERLAPLWRDAPVDYVCAADISVSRAGLAFTVQTRAASARLTSSLRGPFNVENLLTSVGLLLARGVELNAACAALAGCKAAPGRMQAEGGGELPLVLIDYAHTPDALAKAIAAARLHCQGRLWCVFGCGGERDRGKRSQMGRVAAEGADCVVITDDNPRGEDAEVITSEIMAGVAMAGGAQRARVIHDRGDAIAYATGSAATEDVVLVAGKGHEDYQLVGPSRRPFSDTAWVRGALARRRVS